MESHSPFRYVAMMEERERTPYEIIYCPFYLAVFEGLSLRVTSRAIVPQVKRTDIAVWNCDAGAAISEEVFEAIKIERRGNERVNVFAINETRVSEDWKI